MYRFENHTLVAVPSLTVYLNDSNKTLGEDLVTMAITIMKEAVIETIETKVEERQTLSDKKVIRPIMRLIQTQGM